jgi:AraC-like DNA-binding protein
MNHQRIYVTSPLLSLSRFDHPGSAPHRDPFEEIARSYSVSFIEKGNFSLRIEDRRWQMSRGKVFLTYPGMIFRCRHAEEFPEDVSFSVTYSNRFFDHQDDLRSVISKRTECVAALDNRLAYLHMRLTALIAGHADVMTAEIVAGELFAAATEAGVSNRRLHNTHQLAWYAERVEAARRLMESTYNDKHTLSSLARFTGMSPFHFARIFRELIGTPPHRFLMNVRLARASEMLIEKVSVTEACFATGFANLSHFIRLFQRTFGVSPSKFSRAKTQTVRSLPRMYFSGSKSDGRGNGY